MTSGRPPWRAADPRDSERIDPEVEAAFLAAEQQRLRDYEDAWERIYAVHSGIADRTGLLLDLDRSIQDAGHFANLAITEHNEEKRYSYHVLGISFSLFGNLVKMYVFDEWLSDEREAKLWNIATILEENGFVLARLSDLEFPHTGTIDIGIASWRPIDWDYVFFNYW